MIIFHITSNFIRNLILCPVPMFLQTFSLKIIYNLKISVFMGIGAGKIFLQHLRSTGFISKALFKQKICSTFVRIMKFNDLIRLLQLRDKSIPCIDKTTDKQMGNAILQLQVNIILCTNHIRFDGPTQNSGSK